MKLKKFNNLLAILLVLSSLFEFYLTNNINYLVFILAVPIPYIFKLAPSITCIYFVYVFLTAFLGLIGGWFKIIHWYDSFTHFLWGFVSSLFAIYILEKLKMFDKKNLMFNLLFIFVFTLASAGLWEIFEFTVDNLFDRNMQRVETGVFDTMKDIIVAVLGNLLFLLGFYYEYKEDKELLIKKIQKGW